MARKIRTLSALLAALALVCPLSAEPAYRSVSVSQTVGSTSLPRFTLEVTIVSDGPDTCYYRLFTDADTVGNATTSSAPIKSGEAHQYPFKPAASPSTEYPSGIRGTESFGPDGKRASYYSSISAICASGKTASWRVFAK